MYSHSLGVLLHNDMRSNPVSLSMLLEASERGPPLASPVSVPCSSGCASSASTWSTPTASLRSTAPPPSAPGSPVGPASPGPPQGSPGSGLPREDRVEERVKPKRQRDAKKVSSELKERKRPRKAPAKRVKATEKPKDEDGSEDNGNSSEDGDSRSSAEKEKPATKKVASTPVYGKRVEHLKSVIKSCGMSVPPVLYKRVNQEPEDKRESRLIKELQEILSKEGLSANPSEKEVKEVRKKKERAKELEGIDVSNVLSSTRRRSTSYVAPPKPKIPIDSDAESSEEEDDDEEEDEEDDEENNDGGNDGSQSDGSNVDDEVNSD